MKGIADFLKRPSLWLILIFLLYLSLLLPTIERPGVRWDEQTDLDIAHSYLNTVMGVYTLSRREFDNETGLLACLILATSPFFLSFSRVAFTESDIFVTCALTWSLVCISILQKRRTVGFVTVTAIVLGIARSLKFTVFSICPAVFVVPAFRSQNGIRPYRNTLSRKNIIAGATIVSLMFMALGTVMRIVYFGIGTYNFLLSRFRLYLMVLDGWACFLGWLLFHGRSVLRPLTLCSFVMGFFLLTFLVIPPVHTTRPSVLKGLIGKFLFEITKPGFLPIAEMTGLHVGSVFFKSSLLIGGLLCLNMVFAIPQYPSRKEVRLPVLVSGFYCL